MYPADAEKYLLWAKMPQFQRKINAASDILRNALEHSNAPALSFSSGKDSVVLLDLAVRAGFKGRLLFFRYGVTYLGGLETPKENVDLLEYYANTHSLEYVIMDCLGESDCWEMCRRFTLYPETAEEKQAFNLTNYDFKNKSREFQKKYDIDLNIIGMRKDESRTRKIMLSKKGAIYSVNAREGLTCCPLLNFSNVDIWAYIFSRGLEYLSVYDYPYINREKNRNEVTMLYNSAILENGMIFHYKQMYPEYFNAIEARWGDVF